MLLPKKIGPFTLMRKLGSDGVTDGFVGILDEPAGKQVVVNQLLPWVLRDAARLAAIEARIADLTGIRHPVLVPVTESVVVGEDRFIVEEYADAVDLERVLQWCRDKRLSLPHNIYLNLATQICNGLEALHGRPGKASGAENVLHLALQPSAILLTPDGKLVVGGYGLVRSPTSLPHTALEGNGGRPPRMEYLSPEQTHPDQKLTPASDIFSLGALLFELLTLDPLFRAESNLQTIHRVRRAEVTTPLLRVKEILPGLDKVLYRALSLNPRHRYQRAFVLREDLRGLMSGFSFARIAEETREFLAPLFEARGRGAGAAPASNDPLHESTAGILAAAVREQADLTDPRGADDTAALIRRAQEKRGEPPPPSGPSTLVPADDGFVAEALGENTSWEKRDTRPPPQRAETRPTDPALTLPPPPSRQTTAPKPHVEAQTSWVNLGDDDPSTEFDDEPPTSQADRPDAPKASSEVSPAPKLTSSPPMLVEPPAPKAAAPKPEPAPTPAAPKPAAPPAKAAESKAAAPKAPAPKPPPPEPPTKVSEPMVQAVSWEDDELDAPRRGNGLLIGVGLVAALGFAVVCVGGGGFLLASGVGGSAGEASTVEAEAGIAAAVPAAAAEPDAPSEAAPTETDPKGATPSAPANAAPSASTSRAPAAPTAAPSRAPTGRDAPSSAPSPSRSPSTASSPSTTSSPSRSSGYEGSSGASPTQASFSGSSPSSSRKSADLALAVEPPPVAPPEDDGLSIVFEAGSLESYSAKAHKGSLSDTERFELESVGRDSPDYSRARVLLYEDAKARGDRRDRKTYLDSVMSVPENQYNPALLVEQASFAIETEDYHDAIARADLAERHWQRLPSELIFSRKAMIYEIQAAGWQGVFYQSGGEDLEALQSAIRSWQKYQRHAETRSRQDLSGKADAQLAKLYDMQRRLE